MVSSPKVAGMKKMKFFPILQKYGKFWSISLAYQVKRKPHISDEYCSLYIIALFLILFCVRTVKITKIYSKIAAEITPKCEESLITVIQVRHGGSQK